MDIEKLIEQLRKSADFEDYPIVASFAAIIEKKYLRDAATALSTLQGENVKLLEELEQVKRGRDAAVKDMAELIGAIEEIRRGYGVDNDDADSAFAGLCGNDCANNSHGCYKKGSNGYYCANFRWRDQKED